MQFLFPLTFGEDQGEGFLDHFTLHFFNDSLLINFI